MKFSTTRQEKSGHPSYKEKYFIAGVAYNSGTTVLLVLNKLIY